MKTHQKRPHCICQAGVVPVPSAAAAALAIVTAVVTRAAAAARLGATSQEGFGDAAEAVP